MFHCAAVPEAKEVEPVGRWYEAICLRQRTRHYSHSRTSFHNSSGELESFQDEEGENGEEVGTEEEDEESIKYLKNLDPKLWKVCKKFHLF